MTSTREAYVAYITKLLTLAKQPDPAGAATRILALETEIATPQWDRARNRDRNATYNKMTVAAARGADAGVQLERAISRRPGSAKATDVVVRQPDYIKARRHDHRERRRSSTWREYLTFKLLDDYADELPAAFVQARFDFRGKTLIGPAGDGARAGSARWTASKATLGEAAGKLYVAQYFKPEAKARMDALVKNLLDAYTGRHRQPRVDEPRDQGAGEGQARALHGEDRLPRQAARLLDARDQARRPVRQRDARARVPVRRHGVSRLGKPVDRTRWGMTPQTVNAYYNPIEQRDRLPGRRSCSRRSST